MDSLIRVLADGSEQIWYSEKYLVFTDEKLKLFWQKYPEGRIEFG